MNFNLDAKTLVEAVGFLALLFFMLKTNKDGFESVENSSKKGFEMVDLKINNLIQMIALEREGTRKDICFLEGEIEGVKDQFKAEIYPRLNMVEQDVKKNCQALIDHQQLCSAIRQNIKH